MKSLLMFVVLIGAASGLGAQEADKALDQLKGAAGEEAQAAAVPEPAPPERPVALMEQSFENGRDGISLSEASALCEKYRSLHKSRYFYVYCVFHEKNWTELHMAQGTYTDYRMLGYVTDSGSSSSSFDIGNRKSALWGLYEREGRAVASDSSSYYHSEPVIMPVEVPYTYYYETAHVIYGLRVMGWGAFGKGSPWKTLYSSLGLFGGAVDVTFATEREAVVSCREALLAAGQMNPKYYRAECSAFKGKELDRYHYEVRTQNPLY